MICGLLGPTPRVRILVVSPTSCEMLAEMPLILICPRRLGVLALLGLWGYLMIWGIEHGACLSRL